MKPDDTKPPFPAPWFDRPSMPLGKRGLQALDPQRATAKVAQRQTGDTWLLHAATARQPPKSPGPQDMLVRCSGAQNLSTAWQSAQEVGCKLIRFDTGDPFVVLEGDLRHRSVTVAQGFASNRDDTCNQVFEALQSLWAARSAHSAEHLVLMLPESCDPQTNPTGFNRLLVQLAKACGAREIRYESPLGDAADTPSERVTPATVAAKINAATCAQEADALRALAYTLSKQTGNRDMPEAATAWKDVVRQGIRKATACPTADTCHHIVLSVHANPDLGDAVAQALGDAAQVGTHTFGGAVPEVRLSTKVAGQHVVIVHSLRPAPSRNPAPYAQGPTQTMEALALAQAAREAGASYVTVVQAYQLNGRSDREEHTLDDTHAGAYCAMVAKCFDATKCDAAVLVECHDLHTPTYWSGHQTCPCRGWRASHHRQCSRTTYAQ